MIIKHDRHLSSNSRGAQRHVGFFLIVLFGCWLAGQTNSNHVVAAHETTGPLTTNNSTFLFVCLFVCLFNLLYLYSLHQWGPSSLACTWHTQDPEHCLSVCLFVCLFNLLYLYSLHQWGPSSLACTWHTQDPGHCCHTTHSDVRESLLYSSYNRRSPRHTPCYDRYTSTTHTGQMGRYHEFHE